MTHLHVAAQQLALEVLHALGVKPVPALTALEHVVIEFARFAAIAINLLFIHAMLFIPAELVRLLNNR